jgi:NADH-quinone oxidoreductase subunit J
MIVTFYVAAVIALFSTIKVITQTHAVRALLYLIVSLLSVAIIFFTLGAPFAAALEVISYAGAILVLFIFAMMMLNIGPKSVQQEKQWMNPKLWFGPSFLSLVLLGEFIFVFGRLPNIEDPRITVVEPQNVGAALFGAYALGVELASMLLLAGLVGAYHIGYRTLTSSHSRQTSLQPLLSRRHLRLVHATSPEKKVGSL